MKSSNSSTIQACLDEIKASQPGSHDKLLEACQLRLRLLIQAILVKYQRLTRWEAEDDILQNVLLRLDKALRALTIESTTDFLRLSAALIRRELIDLIRRHFGKHSQGNHHQTPIDGNQYDSELFEDKSGLNPFKEAELHELVNTLSDELRIVFELVHYHGMTQDEVANLLSISVRSVKRMWQQARLDLAKAISEKPSHDIQCGIP